MPPYLREQFESPAGQEELLRSLRDKRLLAEEARRRGLHQEPSIARQVRELEERLAVQALLAQELKEASAQDPRAWFDAHKLDFEQPPRVRLARVLVRLPEGTRPKAAAWERARGYAARLRKGESPLKVGREGDGPEAPHGGDLGFMTVGDIKDTRAANTVALLQVQGAVSDPVETDDGLSVYVVLEKRPARIPPYEEVKTEVQARMQPMLQRHVFNQVVARLRQREAAGGGPP